MNMNDQTYAESKVFKHDGEDCIDPKFLETFDFKDDQLIEIVYPEMSSLCPFNGMPDRSVVVIKYVPDGVAVELKSLKFYFRTFYTAGVSQERLTQLIHKHMVELLKTDVYVETQYGTRGGIDVNAKQGSIKSFAVEGGVQQ